MNVNNIETLEQKLSKYKRENAIIYKPDDKAGYPCMKNTFDIVSQEVIRLGSEGLRILTIELETFDDIEYTSFVLESVLVDNLWRETQTGMCTLFKCSCRTGKCMLCNGPIIKLQEGMLIELKNANARETVKHEELRTALKEFKELFKEDE